MGSDPGWPERTPRRLLLALFRQLPVLEARELLSLKMVMAYPYLKENDQRALNSQLGEVAYPDPPARPGRKPVVEHNPEKAAAYFRAMGVRVVTKRGES